MKPKVVLITGALTGIGNAAARALAQEGASLVISGRRQAEGDKLGAELRSIGGSAEFRLADVRHDEEVRRLVDYTVGKFGRLDGAINNAGTEGQPGLIVDQTPESYAATFETNVLGTLLCLKYEMRVMAAKRAAAS
jgi:NAD(P)-dependent dehydrogenase (short-subunit alcohol dehydrogenase family)